MAKTKHNREAKSAKVPSKPTPELPTDVSSEVVPSEVPSEVPSFVPTTEPEIFGPDFQRFERYIDDCTKFNESVQGHFDRLQKQIKNASSRDCAIKRKIDVEVNNSNKREKEVLGYIHDLQEAYDRNTKKLRDHHQKQISHLVDKHKLEMAKWKSKYEKVKFDKKIDQVEVDDAVHTHLQSKLDKVTSELSDWQSKFENIEEQLRNVKKEKVSAQNDLKELRNENSKLKSEVTSKDKELGKLNDRVKNLESKIAELKKVEPKSVPKNDKPKSEHKDDNAQSESLDELKNELDKIKTQLDAKTDICAYLRKEVADYKTKVSKFEGMVNEEKNKSTQHIREIERFQRDLEKNKGALQNKESEIMVSFGSLLIAIIFPYSNSKSHVYLFTKQKLKCNMDENNKNLEMKLKVIGFPYSFDMPEIDFSIESWAASISIFFVVASYFAFQLSKYYYLFSFFHANTFSNLFWINLLLLCIVFLLTVLFLFIGNEGSSAEWKKVEG